MAVVDVDEPEVIGHAHWNVFVPAAVFALLCATVWGVLDTLDRGTTMPARFAFLVAVLVTPLLALLSFLRYQTTRVSRTFDGLWVERGWPNMTPRHVDFHEIAGVSTEHSLIGGRFGAGHLRLFLTSGESVRVRDLARVDQVAERIRRPAGIISEG